MSGPVRLLTAGAGSRWEALLVEACHQGGIDGRVVQRCYDLGDLLAAASGGQADVALLSSGLRWLDREAVGRLTSAGVALVAVVAAADDITERRLRQMGIGVVAAAAEPPERLVALARSAARREPQLMRGSAPDPPAAQPSEQHLVVAVWGAKGAPGRTTVAANLAFQAARAAGETLLVDADTYGGSVAQLLGFLEETPGLAWAARAASRGELDVPRLWQATRRAAPTGPRTLLGLPRAELWTELRPSTWATLLELFRAAFPLTVLDLGFCLEEEEELLYDQVRLRRNAVTRLALQQADVVLAVARADPVGLHDFILAYQSLRDLELDRSRVRVVVNQVRGGLFKGDPVGQVGAALNRFLGVQPVCFIPYDRVALDAATAAGRAVGEVRPQSPFTRAIASLAVSLLPADRAARQQHGRRPLRLGRGA